MASTEIADILAVLAANISSDCYMETAKTKGFVGKITWNSKPCGEGHNTCHAVIDEGHRSKF